MLHRRLKTHARAHSVAWLESMISTSRHGPAAGDPLGEVFSTTFPAHRKLPRKPIFESRPQNILWPRPQCCSAWSFCAGTRLLHRRLKTHARGHSVAWLESMISTSRHGPAAGDPLGEVFPTIFPAHRKLPRKPIFESRNPLSMTVHPDSQSAPSVCQNPKTVLQTDRSAPGGVESRRNRCAGPTSSGRLADSSFLRGGRSWLDIEPLFEQSAQSRDRCKKGM